MKRKRIIWLLMATVAIAAVACTNSSHETGTAAPVATEALQLDPGGVVGAGDSTADPRMQPTQETLTTTPTPGSIEDRVLSEPELPKGSVFFQVTVPENTPPGDRVFVAVHPVDSNGFSDHIELHSEGNNTYSGEVEVPSGGLVRYAYDRWDEQGCCEDTLITRESLFTGAPVGYRSLIAHRAAASTNSQGRLLVRDVVPQWNDLETEFKQVEVKGRIVDTDTFVPLMDVDVTVAGVHVATDFDGRFIVPGIAPGFHRIVATTATGSYAAFQHEIEVGEAGLDLTAELRMRRTQTVPVQFTVELPEGTPPNAGVFIAGNLRELGARPGGTQLPDIPSGISMPIMSRNGDRATITLDLPAGEYVEYFYTLGSDVVAEVESHNRRFRNFIVGDVRSTRNDLVTAWGNEDWPLVVLRIDVPSNTPEGIPVYLRTGPTHRMNQTGPNQWVTMVGSHPPGAEYRYRISLGDDLYGSDGSPGLDEQGGRSFTIPERPQEMAIKVTKWAHLPDPTLRDESNGLTVTFRLSVPPDTPEGATIMLTGDRPAVGAHGTVMQPVSGNRWLYQADVNFGHDGLLRYRYTVADTGNRSDELTVGTDFHGQEVNDYVVSWDEDIEERDGWISGLFTPDFWSESFLPSSDSAFDAGVEANGGWVAISSVWSFGQIQPEPFLESRPLRIWTVLTPLEDIRAQAAVAKEQGLKIFLAPQMNPEIHPNWQDQTVSAGSRDWWEQWLVQAEAQWMWNGMVGEEIGAEMLMLPGYVFHVFPPPGFFHDEDYVPEFDLKVQELIGKVREVYSGKILISGGQTDYDFPGLADYVGVTTFDIGVPDLPATATFDELKDHYAAGFARRVDRLWERWSKPVLLYTIHADGKPQADDEFGQLFQAAAYEAIFQEIADRPFVTGSFSWAFDYIGVWQFQTSGVRDRAAGAVMAKWYERLGG